MNKSKSQPAAVVPEWAAKLHDILHELIRGRCRSKEDYHRLEKMLDEFIETVEKETN